MDHEPGYLSRRTFVSANAVLLAAVGLRHVIPGKHSAGPAQRTAQLTAEQTPATNGITDLALYRPVSVSSTNYGPTPASFAVDRLAETGVTGSGWRAASSDPQWITVDLQAPCDIESVVLVFEATAADAPWVPASGSNPYEDTTGDEIMSSCATAFQLETSSDGTTWQTVYQTTSGTGGVTQVTLPASVTARWIKLTATAQANSQPLGLNSFQVYGTCAVSRPPATGWTNWPVRKDVTPPPLSVAPDGTVPIESGWDLTLDDWAGSTSGAALSGQVDTSTWLPATVPGTVLTTLVEQGHLPDPVEGFNNLHIPEALSRHSWWYRRTFTVPGGFRTDPGGHVWLEFDGINHEAEIWLNGTQVGTLTYPFARSALDVTSALRDGGEQILAVSISPMPHPGSPGDKGPSGVSFENSSEVYLDSPTYLSVSGWDWMPAVRDRVAGIWNHVRLRTTGAAVLGDPWVDTALPDLPDTSPAEVTVVVPVQNASSASQRITVTAALSNVRVSTTVTVAAGQSTDVTFTPSAFPALKLKNPQLWWPNGYGDPTLHDLVMTAAVGGAVSDSRTRQVGLRQYDYASSLPVDIDFVTDSGTQTENFPSQQARYVRIYCEDRATSWGFSMWTLSVFDTSSPGSDLALNKTATASSIDNTGDEPANATDGSLSTRWSSAYEDNQWIAVDLGSTVSFDQIVIVWEQAYAVTYIIQVSNDGSTWTDVLSVNNTPTPLKISVNGVPVLCRGGNWGWDELLRRMLPDRMDNVLKMHRDMNFTMIRNWSGNSNREEFFAACDANGILVWNEFWQSDGLFPPSQSYGVFLDIAQDTILRYRSHPCIAVWCGANESEPPADIDTGLSQAVTQLTPGLLYQGNSATGIVTGGGPYDWVDPVDYFSGSTYEDGSFGFHTEIGIPTVPVTASMKTLIGDTPDADYDLPIAISSADQATQTVDFASQRARYLRIQCYQRATGWGFSMWTLSVFNTSSPGTDLALNKTATASSIDNTGDEPANATDGSLSTRWSSAYEDNQWIAVDLGSTVSFDQIQIVWEQAYALNYTIQVSADGTTWADVKTVYNGGPWYLHDWCTQGNQNPDTYKSAIDTLFGPSVTLDEFCRKAQFVNYENMRAIFEAWNANLWDNGTAIMLWMSNPAWRSTVWQTYDYDLDVNGSYYGSKKGCEPVHVQANMSDWTVLVANHTAQALTGVSVTAALYNLSGSSLGGTQSQTVNVASSSTTTAFTVPFTDSLPSPHLLKLTLTGKDGVTAENVYWRYNNQADMQALNQLAAARVSASAGRVTADGTARQATVSLRNTGTSTAAMISFSLRDRASGARILPAFYSESYVWLLPGESQPISVSWQSSGADTDAELVVDGYNLAAVTVPLT
jgi:Exo-beta-D-glucosaminidase Ig-fold domain/F5/8 type C domain/Glycosyl hydrolases family 2/Glycosyl hydrolases family 2, sugar binding domain